MKLRNFILITVMSVTLAVTMIAVIIKCTAIASFDFTGLTCFAFGLIYFVFALITFTSIEQSEIEKINTKENKFLWKAGALALIDTFMLAFACFSNLTTVKYVTGFAVWFLGALIIIICAKSAKSNSK